MDDAGYTIVFHGEILDGHDPVRVRARVAGLFKLSAERAEQLFSGARVLLKRNLNAAEAERFRDLLTRMGLRAFIEPPLHVTSGGTPPAQERPSAGESTGAEGRVLSEPRKLAFEFHGSGSEFFRIWIVNLFLTLITLGVYSAWAKVRTLRYFYGNTRLDGSAFDYLANPMDILKGRVIAFVLFGAYSFASNLDPIAALAATLVFFLLMPWLVVRSLVFRARNSAWRNVRFQFSGTAGGAFSAFVLWPLLGFLTLGLLFPLALQRQARFMVENSGYGTTPFEFHASGNDYFKAMLTVFGIFLLGGLGALAIVFVHPFLAPFAFAAVYLLAFIFMQVSLANLKYNNTTLGEHGFSAKYATGSYAILFLTNTIGIILTLGLFYPWAKVRSARYAAEHTEFFAAGGLDHFIAAEQDKVSALGQEVGDFFDVEFGL